ncbi:DUF3833 domain-containing protein [Aliiroseovarius marinus]|uniref:DUF3833 domain-containing protein n=1 Tax=Aliiroseovarius marinus TaxID=2500159 RepID=UPI00249550A2|nr:DUF3833 domain-containing protein [Aliiroseovarius marinus]
MKLVTAILALFFVATLTRHMFFSFKAQAPEDYADTGPAFSLTEHLSGEILSEGLIYGPTGRVTNSFTARMVGQWEGNTGTLTEDFIYSNGRTQARKWFLTLGDNNTFTATADDIVGTAQGTVSGSTIKMTYDIVLPAEAGGHTLSVTDWLYMTESGVILNRSEMRKFGIKVAELVATMRPDPTR